MNLNSKSNLLQFCSGLNININKSKSQPHSFVLLFKRLRAKGKNITIENITKEVEAVRSKRYKK